MPSGASSHEPFHWFIEFYGVMKQGGFDVIVGNPPYVEYRKVEVTYRVQGFSTLACGDLYAYVLERSVVLFSSVGRLGMIVPVSIVSTDGFDILRDVLTSNGENWNVSFAERPAKLFSGVEKRLTIWLAHHAQNRALFTSQYHRWYSEERENLFALITYAGYSSSARLVGTSISKIGSGKEKGILEKLARDQPLDQWFLRASDHYLYYMRKGTACSFCIHSRIVDRAWQNSASLQN